MRRVNWETLLADAPTREELDAAWQQAMRNPEFRKRFGTYDQQLRDDGELRDTDAGPGVRLSADRFAHLGEGERVDVSEARQPTERARAFGDPEGRGDTYWAGRVRGEVGERRPCVLCRDDEPCVHQGPEPGHPTPPAVPSVGCHADWVIGYVVGKLGRGARWPEDPVWAEAEQAYRAWRGEMGDGVAAAAAEASESREQARVTQCGWCGAWVDESRDRDEE